MGRRLPWVAWALASLLAALAIVRSAELGSLEDEVAVMLTLREALWDSGVPQNERWFGWQPGMPHSHCSWSLVQCDDAGRIKKLYFLGKHIQANATSAATPAFSAALAGLTRLQWIESLSMGRFFATPVPHAVLEAWVQPGALPRLKRLNLDFYIEGPLPDIPPGALPKLESFSISFDEFQGTLPASWGASPATLPSLEFLNLRLQVEGRLPPEWARGFPKLDRMDIHDSTQYQDSVAASRQQQQQPLRPPLTRYPLPAEWATGFPSLTSMGLRLLPVKGTIPAAWADGGFPLISDMALMQLSLTGTLPANIFATHPHLKGLQFSGNHFTGMLPDAWADSRLLEHLDLANNSLSGPAFPPAWLAPGAMRAVHELVLSSNPAITGTLPADLAWPLLMQLELDGTNLTGSLPESWCHAPFTDQMLRIHLNHTGVDPAFPSCIAQAMPRLGSLDYAHAPQPRWPARRWSPTPVVVLVLLVVVLLGGIAASWAAGRGLARRKTADVDMQPASFSADVRREDMEQLLQHSGSLRAGSAAQGGADGQPRFSRRARLSALVKAQLSRRSGNVVELLPMARLDKALAHHLAPHLGGSSRGVLQQGDPGADVGAQCARAGGAEQAQPLLPEARFERVAAWQREAADHEQDTPFSDSHTAAGVSESPSGGSAVDPPASRAWGLETLSLRVTDGDLEFVTDGKGQLVALGEGAHAVVYLARLQGVHVAVKCLELPPGLDSAAAWREASLMRRCIHPRVVPLFGVALKGPLLMLAMEFMRGGSLRVALQDPSRRPTLRWGAGGRQVATDVAEGLAFLHGELRIMHSDLKSGNVLLTEDMRACLGDMSVAQVIESGSRTTAGFCCTHAAPEQLLGKRCTLAADLYGFGVLLIELTTQLPVEKRGSWRLPRVPEECPQAVLDLILTCIAPDPAHRCTAADALARLRSPEAAAAACEPA